MLLAASPWPLVLAAVAAGFGTAAAVGAWLWRRQQALSDQLHDERETTRALRELADGWLWRSDARQKIVEMRPPPGHAGSSPLAAAAGRDVDEVFRSANATPVTTLLASQAPLDAVEVQVGAPGSASTGMPAGPAPDGPPARLHARPWRDRHGRWAGHLGLLRTAAPLEDRDTAEAMRAEVDSFSYTVSHDLRAPLRVVEGFSRIVKEDYGRQLDRIGHDHLDRVMAAAARMNAMIDALLELSRLSTQPVSRQRVDLSQQAAWVVDELRRQAPAREVDVRIEPGLLAHGDPTLLRLVLDNLLSNAWKYTARRADAQIWFGRSGAGTYTVRDNGAGFDMRFADRLFGVFQRLHSANDFNGTGVGLASVRRIVRRHGGEAWAEAEVGRGASFHFSLPERN